MSILQILLYIRKLHAANVKLDKQYQNVNQSLAKRDATYADYQMNLKHIRSLANQIGDQVIVETAALDEEQLSDFFRQLET